MKMDGRRVVLGVFGSALAAATPALAQPSPAPAQPSPTLSQPSPVQNTPPVQTGMPAATPSPNWAPPASFSEWASSIKYGAQIDAGIVGNPQNPNNSINYGQLFTDKANRPILNQLLLTAQRDIDPKATSYDYGFKLQGLYGSDARIVHSLGLFDHAIHDRNQIDILEANAIVHTPWAFEGGIDIKGGIYPTPLGYELIDPKTNPFYTHSYIFNYGLPYKHLGVLTTSHVSGLLDLYLGLDTGTNVTLADGDNNRRPGGIFGFGLNLLGGNLTVLALSHVGPEDAKNNTSAAFANSKMRYYNDIVVTYKATPKLGFTTELNYVKEDGFRAEGYGAAQYVAYTINDQFTANFRAEIWRDNSNFFVSTPVNNLDYVNFERGYPSNFYTAQRPTTYSALTAGVTWKPAGLPSAISTLEVRPEIRYDRSLSNSKPFGNGDKGQVLIAADVVLGF